jgi:SAM-dependent methyltransferase
VPSRPYKGVMTTAGKPGSSSPRIPAEKQPGHWVLASLGKRVLRPGGLGLTRQMIDRLRPAADDKIVEFAPGLGATARLVLAARSQAYTAIERDELAASRLRDKLGDNRVRILTGSAEKTGLPERCASVVYGEAMLSMQTPEQKRRIIAEAFRILEPGGRYGIHELALLPADIDDGFRVRIEREMSMNIHHAVRPVTIEEWDSLLREAGFEVRWRATAPMHLLEPQRLLADEGVAGALKIAVNLLRRPAARRRAFAMRAMFRQYSENLAGVAMVAVKPIGV